MCGKSEIIQGPAIADCLQCSENRTIAENSSQKTLAYSESKRDIPIMGNCACSPNFKEGSNFTCEKSYIQNKDDALIVALSFFVTFLLSLIVVKLFQKKSREQSLLISRMEGSILKPQKEALNQEDTKDTLKTRDGRLDNRIFETERAILTTER
jgi:hypothetical protein